MSDLLKFDQAALSLPAGLHNVSGMHCYWNATLQALLSCPQFIQTINRICDLGKNNFITAMYGFLNGKLSNMELYNIYIKSLHLIGKPVEQLRELASNQQCAGETLTYIMELFEHVPDVIRLFEHRYTHELGCLNCKYISHTKTTSIMFELNPTTNLEKDIYETVEIIQDYKCEKCKDVGNKPKRSRLTMLPELIVIIVKNYMWNEHGGAKQMAQTTFPEFLEFKPLRYRAVAYIDHFGHLNAGHYTATGLRRDSQGNLGWFNFNDSSSSPSGFAPSAATYMAFYSYDPTAAVGSGFPN